MFNSYWSFLAKLNMNNLFGWFWGLCLHALHKIRTNILPNRFAQTVNLGVVESVRCNATSNPRPKLEKYIRIRQSLNFPLDGSFVHGPKASHFFLPDRQLISAPVVPGRYQRNEAHHRTLKTRCAIQSRNRDCSQKIVLLRTGLKSCKSFYFHFYTATVPRADRFR